MTLGDRMNLFPLAGPKPTDSLGYVVSQLVDAEKRDEINNDENDDDDNNNNNNKNSPSKNRGNWDYFKDI